MEGEEFFLQRQPFAPDTMLVLDFVEFVYAAVAQPILGKHHDYFNHHLGLWKAPAYGESACSRGKRAVASLSVAQPNSVLITA